MPLLQNTVVRASAGTGKTHKLVETWVDLVAGGTDPMRVVAMTFTEKAAGEMRDRIRKAIRERMMPESAAQANWLRVLSVLPAAPLSTIHGFCGLLLREHGLHAGIDPSFSILDEQRSLDLARAAAVETLRNQIRSGDPDAQRLFGDFGLHELVEIMVGAAYWMNSLGKDATWLQECAERQAEAAKALYPSVAEHMQQFKDDFEELGRFVDELEAKKARHSLLRKQDDPDGVLPRIGQIAGAAVAQALAKLIGQSIACFQANKRAANVMDFDDLLIQTRNLLRDNETVRLHYQQYYQALLIDEFQDTDEVQADILRLLAQDPGGGGFARSKLLIVGDPKQSIYRFRRARVTVFVHMMQQILDGGGAIEHLRENRRSAPPLVEFSNLLSQSMLDGLGKVRLPADVDTSYRIPFSETDVLEPRSERRFLGITYMAADPELRAAEGRAMEAEALARVLKAWKATGVIQSWREVAFLMRSMSNVDTYAEAMSSHGIPVYVVQGATFYQKAEVSDLIAVLELVCHPRDPVARATVLSSSLAGLSFEDLLGGKGSAELDAILQPWIEQRDRATAAEILEDVIRKTNFDVVMMAQKNGEQRVANIGKLIEITRNLGRHGTTSLDDVVRFLRDRARDTSVREPEAQILGQEEDVVRIMTVHQAKGLEFDIVVIPDLAARPRGGSSRVFFSDRWGVLAGAAYGLHRKTFPHALILRAKEEEDDQEYEEEKRLLYVAVTRARRMLVLGEGYSKRQGLWLQWVQSMFEKLHPGVLETVRAGQGTRLRFKSRGQTIAVEMLSAAALTKPQQLALNIDMPTVNMDATYREFELMRSELGAATVHVRRSSLEMTPSDLTTLDGCFRYFHWTRILGVAEPGRLSGTDTPHMKRGAAAHRIMETGSLPAFETLRSHGLEDMQDVFASEDWKTLSKAEVERELAFVMCIPGDGMEYRIRGRMDAVVAGDPLRVIDYKFASWKDGAEAAYEIQLTAYCLALMKSTGLDRAVGELWYLKKPMKIVRAEYTREQAEARLADLLKRYETALRSNHWPAASRTHCDAVFCGFRDTCWSSGTGSGKSELPS